MSLIINHNLMAMTAARNLSTAYGNLATSTRRLSSGLRVTTAADDAAGLAVRELMRADIASLNQGVRNANDAISLIQTADGALGVIDEKLIRMKELAEQAATGTYTSDQRLIIDSEYQAMASEITRIANATDFNGIYLLNGNLSSGTHDGSGLSSTGKLKVHFGSANDSAEDYYYIQIDKATASAFGLGLSAGNSISTQQLAQETLDKINDAIVSKDKIRANLGALQNRLENTISNLEIQAENLQAAESQISDVDVATEMTEFVRQQILTQAAVAMLSQANSLPQMALQLMGSRREVKISPNDFGERADKGYKRPQGTSGSKKGPDRLGGPALCLRTPTASCLLGKGKQPAVGSFFLEQRMASSVSTSGAITFTGLGSGTDFDSIIEQLIEVETAYRVTPLEEWKATWEEKIEAFQELNTQMLALQTALEAIDNQGRVPGQDSHKLRPPPCSRPRPAPMPSREPISSRSSSLPKTRSWSPTAAIPQPPRPSTPLARPASSPTNTPARPVP